MAVCGASLLAFASTAALAKDVSVAAISGYFSQGFGVSIVQGLKKAEKDLGVKVKLIDTGNRSLDYEEQFNNVAKSGEYDLVFVMGWELVDALQKTAAAYPNTHFVFIDGVLDSKTITYANFAENQGSFLAGVLGGMMADKGDAMARQSVLSAGATFQSSETSSPVISKGQRPPRLTCASTPFLLVRSTIRRKAAS
jgi:basic membrane protein A